ncbi:RloB domain-containing protein [Clostridium botulinum]|uniref:RloB family protein n=1 Tax=Clostridium botulinum TaxID=1491 RepID=UPI000381F574|nr:RloB family protein [Clostridium botulinum]MBN1037070.1 RloB domain-containing protein [Clostridium botulinum]
MGGLKRTAEKSREQLRKKRKQNPTIVIICEGKDTETIYLDNFNSKYTKVDVRIADKNSKGKNKGKATDPENLVKKAIEISKKDYDINEKDGDRVWCVFDIDINYNNNNAMQSKINEIQKAKTLSNKNKIRLGISNPCFELWYLLHFEYTTANLKNYDDVKKRLDKYISNYDKNKNVYSELKNNLTTAISNSKKLKKHHESLDKILPNVENDYLKINVEDFVKSNPYTNINELIEYMETLERR